MKNKILRISGLVLLILISFAFATPYLFEGKILNHIKRRLNKDLEARVNFSDLDISWFRHFPHMAIGLNNLQITGIGEFSGDTLVSARELDMAFSLTSAIFGDSISIYSLNLEEPQVHALLLKNGHNNWNILRAGSLQTENKTDFSKPLKFELQSYAIHNGFINFTDQGAGRRAEIANLNQEGRGDFSSEQFILKTKTTAGAVSFDNGGVLPWLSKAKAQMNIVFKVDNRTHTYSIRDGEISFNDLKLHTEGLYQWINDSAYNVDLKFDVPSTEFKNFLSVVPSIYNPGFDSIKTSGSANLTGLIKGRYDNKHRPAYHVYLDIKNGFFQYSDLPKPVQNINLFVHIDNPDGMPGHAVVNIPRGHMEMANDSLDFHMLLKNSGTEPLIDAEARGRLDFSKFSQWSKLEPGTRIKGMLVADAYVRENGSPMERQGHNHDPFKAGGSLDLSNFSYTSASHPGGLSLDEFLLTLHPGIVMINELKGEWMRTQFTADGAFKNLFGNLLKNKPVEGSIHVNADELSLNDWMGINTDTLSARAIPGRKIVPFAVPSNINWVINADIGKVHYDNLDMQNLTANLQIADESIKLNNIKADALEGSILINGSYTTKNNSTGPDIHFSYDAKDLDIQKTFFAFNSMQKIMPVGKFISGKLSGQMTLNGKLGENGVADPATLSGEGKISLIKGELKDFGPLDKLALSLDLAQLKDLDLQNINTDFSFKGNRVSLNSFKVNAGNMEMLIGGSHGFDQSLDYAIRLRVPRKQLGSRGKEWVRNVVEQEANKGIPIQLGDDVNMNVLIGGTINSPVIQTDMNEMIDNAAIDLKQEVNDFVKAKLDSAKQQVRDKDIVLTSSRKKPKYKSGKGPQLAHNKLTRTRGKRKPKSNRKYDS